jgi:enamine deaminase RidA (YjgF/YER057c/UK114 family)
MDLSIVKPQSIHQEPGLYTHAFSAPVDGKRLVVISGQLGIKPDGSIHEDFEGQFLQTYENLRSVLADSGAQLSDLVSLRTYLSRAEQLDEFHSLRKRHYPDWFPSGHYPPNTLLVVSQLYRPDLWLEIEGLALVDA